MSYTTFYSCNLHHFEVREYSEQNIVAIWAEFSTLSLAVLISSNMSVLFTHSHF
jgi:hypothetical protein